MPTPKIKSAETAATVGYEAQLWQMADALRGSMDAAEYKHVCLGLLFLNYIFVVQTEGKRQAPTAPKSLLSSRRDTA